MQIRLNNVGIIKDSIISIDGLTVITGKNNSGKTTVGKTLYALLDAVSNIQLKAVNDRYNYIQRQIEKVESTLEVLRLFRVPLSEEGEDALGNFPALRSLLSREYRHDLPQDGIEKFAHMLATELLALDISLLENSKELKDFQQFLRIRFNGKEGSSLDNMFNNQREQAISILNKLFNDLEKDPELIAYARESINQTLRLEFAGQIQPVAAPDAISTIELFDNDSVFFSVFIKNNSVVDDGSPVFLGSPYKKVFLIDDPFILDDMYSRRVVRGFDLDDAETILNPSRIYSHDRKLRLALKRSKSLSVFEQTVLSNSLLEIREQFNRVIPGTFEFTSEGDYYVKNGSKLKLSNLATGSKMFSILKVLLDKGEIDSTTMLILDEPEAHLHPMWQNAFAEIIALLVKKLDVKILLTTHSPNFMLALDAYYKFLSNRLLGGRVCAL